MTPSFNAYSTTWVVNSGSGVIGATGKPVYLQGLLACGLSSQGLALYSGTAAVTMALVTLTGKSYLPFPMAFPGGLTYQTAGNPGDSDIKLIFFWIPGSST
jgi:uncharacterized membrane protein YkgB